MLAAAGAGGLATVVQCPSGKLAGLFHARWAMFKFTIRDLVLLTLVAALGIGWWADRRRLVVPLAKLAEFERVEKIALQRQQDEERLQELRWKLITVQSFEMGAPRPAGDRPTFTAEDIVELTELSDRLSREKPD
jgi:hypothetical protein